MREQVLHFRSVYCSYGIYVFQVCLIFQKRCEQDLWIKSEAFSFIFILLHIFFLIIFIEMKYKGKLYVSYEHTLIMHRKIN